MLLKCLHIPTSEGLWFFWSQMLLDAKSLWRYAGASSTQCHVLSAASFICFHIQALNKKEHRGCESPDADASYVLTPSTEEKYKKINEEFDNMMKSHKIVSQGMDWDNYFKQSLWTLCWDDSMWGQIYQPSVHVNSSASFNQITFLKSNPKLKHSYSKTQFKFVWQALFCSDIDRDCVDSHCLRSPQAFRHHHTCTRHLAACLSAWQEEVWRPRLWLQPQQHWLTVASSRPSTHTFTEPSTLLKDPPVLETQVCVYVCVCASTLSLYFSLHWTIQHFIPVNVKTGQKNRTSIN